MDMDGVDDTGGETEEITPGGFIPLNDDDDDEDGYVDKDDPDGVAGGDDDLVKLTNFKLLPEGSIYPPDVPVDAEHPIVLSVLSGASKIRIYENAGKSAPPLSLPKSYTSRQALPSELWVEGYEVSVDPCDVVLALQYTLAGKTFEDIIKVTVVKVDKIQYDDPLLGYTDVPDLLHVHKGTTVTFKAIPDPPGASWPSGKPMWGGTAGASGTGETKVVTFSTLSANTSDYKTVTAECNNTVTANVIVFDFEGVLTPDDDFEYRSLDDYGVEETVSLSHTTNPTGITGLPLEWEIHSGVGSIVEESKYDAGAIAGAVTLKLELQSGPSKGKYKSYNKTVHAPTYRFARSRFETGIYHIYQRHGIKFKGEYFVDPTNVSFTNIELREGTSTPADGEGYFEPKDGYVHTPGSWLTPAYPNTEWGCWWAVDTTGFEGTSSDYIGQSGTFTNCYIDIEYRGDDSVERGIGTIESLMTVDTDGYSLIKKGSVGWVPVFFSHPTTNPTW